MGRPSEYTSEIAQGICERLAAGESLRAICKPDTMPSASTVCGWNLDNREGFAEQYARAREMQAECFYDELVEIADDGRNDYTTRTNPEDGSVEAVLNAEHIQRSRLRVDTRKWAMSKILVKRYGDKLVHQGDDDAPIAVRVIRGDL